LFFFQSKRSEVYEIFLIKMSNEFVTQNGIINPIFTTSESLETKIETKKEEKNAINITNRTRSNDNDQKPILPKTNRFFQMRPSINSFDQIDIKFLNKSYTIKKRTFVNYKKFIEIIKPYIILILMLMILLTIFRVDLFVNNPDDFEE
jgi:hypothetical protein